MPRHRPRSRPSSSPTSSRLVLLRKALLAWSAGHRRDFPWRRPGTSPYEVMLAELLLKRTTATAVARAYPDLVRRYPSLQQLSLATEEELAGVLRPIGLFQQRSRAIVRLAAHLMGKEGGTIPSSLERLGVVPGLGDYSSRAILSFGFGSPMAVVDGNVIRVFGRVFHGLLSARPSLARVQEIADRLVLGDDHRQLNLAMLDFGALVCTPSRPKCGECPVSKACDYHRAPGTAEGPTRDYALRDLRRKAGLSLAALSAKSGVSKTTVRNIEAGRVTPKKSTLRALSNSLGIEIPLAMPYNEAGGVVLEQQGTRRTRGAS